jgi:myo-inositol 2-dehydrogenase/D-chiro-inositol 1-dehydrogenase
MNEPVSIAVIGCGDVAMQRHLPALIANPDVRLTAVCDSDVSRVNKAMKAFTPVNGTTDVDEIFGDPKIDAVIVATPPWVTSYLTIAALRAGKDVLCEKPMALTLARANEVRTVEQGTDRFVQVGFVLRHGPLFGALQRWIAEDRLGTPLDFRISVFDETWNPDDDPEHVERIMATLEHGAPCIHDGAHTMDHLHFLTGTHATRLVSWGRKTKPEFPRPNLNLAVIEFAGDHRARVEIGWLLPNFPGQEWNIIGPKGMATFCQRERRSTLLSDSQNEVVSIDEDWFVSCFQYQLKAFVDGVRTRIAPHPGSAEGIASLALSQQFELGMDQPFAPIEVSSS